MYYTIYKVTNKINGKDYIGKHQTTDLNDGYMGSGKYIKRAIEKYGVDNFEKQILYVYDTEYDMNIKEKELVHEDFIGWSNTYNICVGGQGGFSYINNNKLNYNFTIKDAIKGGHKAKFSLKWKESMKKVAKCPIRKKKLSETRKNMKDWIGDDNPAKRKDVRDKISKANSISQKGSRNSQYGTIWITNGTENKKIKKDLDTIPKGWYKGRSSSVPIV